MGHYCINFYHNSTTSLGDNIGLFRIFSKQFSNFTVLFLNSYVDKPTLIVNGNKMIKNNFKIRKLSLTKLLPKLTEIQIKTNVFNLNLKKQQLIHLVKLRLVNTWNSLKIEQAYLLFIQFYLKNNKSSDIQSKDRDYFERNNKNLFYRRS